MPRSNLSADSPSSHLVSQLDISQWIDDLADDVIAREPIVAEDNEVQSDGRQLIVVDAKEGEHLVEDWIQCFAQHAGLHLWQHTSPNSVAYRPKHATPYGWSAYRHRQ